MSAAAEPLLCLVGPTAAGKSALALEVCERLGGEIVSVDSVQVYRGLDVGSSKPSRDDRARVPHHCIDLAEPTEQLDAAAWVAHADRAIAGIRDRGRLAVAAGGTGLYLRALLRGLGAVPAIDPEIRAEIRLDLAARGPEALHAELARLDPAAAARLSAGDAQRIGRALEVVRQTGRPLSAYQAEHGFRERRYAAIVLGIWPPPGDLRARIEARASRMLAAGWTDEVRRLRARGVPSDRGPLTSLGYREVVGHLEGAIATSDLLPAVCRAHRHYAKRQLTWFRGITAREEGLVHLDASRADLADLVCEHLGRRSASDCA